MFNIVWMPKSAHFHCGSHPPEFYIEQPPPDRKTHNAQATVLFQGNFP
jgi:hypothetical protein